MLRGNLFQEIALGCRTEPDENDLESRVKSVVEFFLRGANDFVKLVETHEIEESVQLRQPEIDAREQFTHADIPLPAILPVQKRSTRHLMPIERNVIRVLGHELKTARQEA